MMQHAAECLAQQTKIKQAQQEWAKRWPGHCSKCLGYGGKAAYAWQPPDFDTCSCWESGKCPRCGHQHADGNRFIEDGEGPCEHCGWDHLNLTPESAMERDWLCLLIGCPTA